MTNSFSGHNGYQDPAQGRFDPNLPYIPKKITVPPAGWALPSARVFSCAGRCGQNLFCSSPKFQWLPTVCFELPTFPIVLSRFEPFNSQCPQQESGGFFFHLATCPFSTHDDKTFCQFAGSLTGYHKWQLPRSPTPIQNGSDGQVHLQYHRRSRYRHGDVYLWSSGQTCNGLVYSIREFTNMSGSVDASGGNSQFFSSGTYVTSLTTTQTNDLLVKGTSNDYTAPPSIICGVANLHDLMPP